MGDWFIGRERLHKSARCAGQYALVAGNDAPAWVHEMGLCGRCARTTEGSES